MKYFLAILLVISTVGAIRHVAKPAVKYDDSAVSQPQPGGMWMNYGKVAPAPPR